jgi:phosphoglycerate kinase
MHDGKVGDDSRIQAALPTIEYLRERGARVILGSHLGRPRKGPDPALSLEPVAAHLANLLKGEVVMPDDCVGDGARRVVRELGEGGVCLLENLRFHEAEEKADAVFASELAALAEVYVNDAFGTAHRAHASTYTMVRHFPENRRAAGLLVARELKFLGALLADPAKPYVAVLGGAKVSDKIKVIENLIGRLDTLLIGGAMAYTFLAAQGVSVGRSLVEADKIGVAASLLALAEARKTRLVLPVDHVIASGIDSTESTVTTSASIPEGLAGFDIGPKTVELFGGHLAKARTIFWNGPLGVFEKPAFNKGTFSVAGFVADNPGMTVVGGGDSVAALVESGRARHVSHVSTGGGASLEFVEGRDLPGIAALRAGHRFEGT